MKNSDLDFNEALKMLKEIVAKLENADLNLEEGIVLIEEGIKLHKYCKDKLDKAQVKITALFETKEE